jgi:FixJ family two-component response regulator
MLMAERYPGPIHLLLTDVVMPTMSGADLARRLAAVRLEMKVLFVSGYTDDAIVHHGVLEPGTAFLEKPFNPEQLVRRVREVLSGRD